MTCACDSDLRLRHWHGKSTLPARDNNALHSGGIFGPSGRLAIEAPASVAASEGVVPSFDERARFLFAGVSDD